MLLNPRAPRETVSSRYYVIDLDGCAWDLRKKKIDARLLNFRLTTFLVGFRRRRVDLNVDTFDIIASA